MSDPTSTDEAVERGEGWDLVEKWFERYERTGYPGSASAAIRTLHVLRARLHQAEERAEEAEERRFAIARVLDDEEKQLALERKLRMRAGGLTRAVGEMEPGGREFCLAAIDEWLDYMVALRDRLGELQASHRRLVQGLVEAGELAGHMAERYGGSLARIVRQAFIDTQREDPDQTRKEPTCG